MRYKVRPPCCCCCCCCSCLNRTFRFSVQAKHHGKRLKKFVGMVPFGNTMKPDILTFSLSVLYIHYTTMTLSDSGTFILVNLNSDENLEFTSFYQRNNNIGKLEINPIFHCPLLISISHVKKLQNYKCFHDMM